jgi:signal transduction histidine kinase
VIWADHDRLEQVFVNLLGNALRHNPAGTRVRVRVRELRGVPGPAGGREVEITVADNGGGFPRQLAGAPFEPARGHRSRSAGAGLGLSIARGIVEAHGGRIELMRPRTGTTFRLRLPVEDPGRAAAAGEGPERALSLAAGGVTGRSSGLAAGGDA